MKVVTETVDYREKNNIDRNDFMDLLIKLKNNGTDESGLGALTLNEIAAQAFIFILAGFETSSTTMAFCLYELAVNPDIQDRARQEIRKVIKRHGGQFTYEAMIEMHYLDQIINGSLINFSKLIIFMQNKYLLIYFKLSFRDTTEISSPRDINTSHAGRLFCPGKRVSN